MARVCSSGARRVEEGGVDAVGAVEIGDVAGLANAVDPERTIALPPTAPQ